MMTDLPSISEAARSIRAGSLRPLDLVERCLGQIDRYESRVRAWVLVDADGARRAAEELGRELKAGRDRGPLHGIPIGIKDLIDVAGWPTRAGSPLRADHVAAADAPLAAALREAGAILLGKTVTVEFACFDPSPTRNPWSPDLSHTPGGSSSGSAAAVATGMCLGALGTQTGGSLVRPSSYCGISTCKPTFGRISLEGVVPVSDHLDHPGPMAGGVADLEMMLRCLPRFSQFGPPDLEVLPASVVARGVDTLSPPRLGLVEKFFMERTDGPVRRAVEATLDRLRDAGARITPVEPNEDFEALLDLHTTVMAVEAAAWHRQQFAAHRDQYGPMISGLLDQGLRISGIDYADALARLRRFRRHAAEMLAGVDALIAPATDTTAPPSLDTTGPKTFQAPWSCSALPVVSMPCGLADDGMPAAIQLVGRPDGEWPLLGVARWCEQLIDFRARPPLLEM